ncbi:uncharacterized protein A4U43_C09F15930 [Asparagus officinalis]|uniref:PORR domain-containing protein n=1 Tax=Asparagus officinalis TaxID=4686 RepID=A0A5P1ECR8_ASPOF|nr:uncharacterized protein A4U43_C09F15930 [Asparagus officinalis]
MTKLLLIEELLWLRLLTWDPLLAVSELQRRSENGDKDSNLAFPISFPRGFGLKRKCAEWLRAVARRAYTSRVPRALRLDRRRTEAEKRVVGVFHEMLHLMVGKKTERRNVSNMRKMLGLPQKFTKVFERHPGIFYISQKLGTHTVVLREGYGGGRELIEKHPVVGVREKYLELMRFRREGLENEEDGDESEDDLGGYSSSDEE